MKKHGHAGAAGKTRTYVTWVQMRKRCRDPQKPYYFGRVTVCERWNDFENFLADMGERPEGTSLDRLNNDIGYEPDNCRWASAGTQSINRRCTIWVSLFGVSLPFENACRLLNIDPANARTRARKVGMSHQETINYQIIRLAENLGREARRGFWRERKANFLNVKHSEAA